MMHLRVQRAIFGERKDGHSLLKASVAESADLGTLTRSTDLPQDMPAGLAWEPFVRGFALGNWYVVAKTFPHPAASRPGMVKTFALLLDPAQVGACDNLAALLALFPTSVEENWPAESSEVEMESANAPGEPPGFAALARAVIKTRNRAVVWLDPEGFLDALAALWLRLWPNARRALRFGLHFAPRGILQQPLNIILVPGVVAARWVDFPCIDQNTPPPTDPSAAEGYLRRLPVGESIREMFVGLGTEPSTIGDLQIAEKCCTLRACGETASLGELRALLRYFVRLAPLQEDGAVWKEDTLQRLLSQSPHGGADDVLALRTLYELPLADIAQRTDCTVAKWILDHLADTQGADENRRILNEALKSLTTHWATALLGGLRTGWSEWRDEFASTVWAWWVRESLLVTKLEPYLPATATVESSLVTASPLHLPEPAASSVRELAIRRGWHFLHAAACAGSLAAADAFASQLAVDGVGTSLDGLQLLASRFPAAATIAASLRHDDQRLVKLAAKLCSKTPELLKPWNASLPEWRHLVAETLGVSAAVWSALGAERIGLRDELLDQLLLGKANETQIWDAISKSSDADLTAFARRWEIWRVLPEPARTRFIDATAAGWTSRFQQTPGFETLLEPELVRIVFPPKPSWFDTRLPQIASIGLAAFTHFSQLSERQFCAWLRDMEAARIEVDQGVAEGLGKLVSVRSWSDAAKSICDLAMHTSSWKPAAQECVDLLGFLRRFRLQRRLDEKQMTPDQFWRALEELAVKLYPRGPTSQELWNRADGHESDLPPQGTGAEQWAAAVRLLRNGGGRKLTAHSLLKAMVNQYNKNEDLRELESFALMKNL